MSQDKCEFCDFDGHAHPCLNCKREIQLCDDCLDDRGQYCGTQCQGFHKNESLLFYFPK